MKIRVNVHRNELYRDLGGQPVHAGIHVGKLLRKAGIPLVGILWIETVESGSLKQWRDGDMFIYEWDSEPLGTSPFADDDEI